MTAILDTSFLFALTDRGDLNHARVLSVAQTASESFLLPSVVLPEVCYLIASRLGHQAMRQFLNNLSTSTIQLEPLATSDLERVSQILEQYADSRLDFVDAVIIAIAERTGITRVLTLDRRDFSLVRPRHCDYFEILP
ncbi:MAG: PIN domain-containing protein [Phormidesmis sp.]